MNSPMPVHTQMSSKEPQWEHFNHEADIGIRGYGATLDEAFAAAGLALTAVITEPERVAAKVRVVIDICENDPEWQFFEFINAIIYEMATRHMLFRRYRVHLKGAKLHAEALGEPVDPKRHQPAVEIKGATLTELRVKAEKPGWSAQCVVDV